MAKSTGLDQRLYVGGYDLSGDVGSINSLGTPRGLFDVTALDKQAMERLLLGVDVGGDFGVFFNDAGDSWSLLSSLPTDDQVVVWAFGSSRGDTAFGAEVKQIDLPWSRAADGGLSATPGIQGSAGSIPSWGEMLTAAKETLASAGSLDSLDGGASSSNGLVAYGHLLSLGSGTPTVEIEDSADDAAWASLVTLSDLTAANTAQRVTVTGSVDRYLRVTLSGTFTDAVLAVMIRRGTAEDIEDLS